MLEHGRVDAVDDVMPEAGPVGQVREAGAVPERVDLPGVDGQRVDA